MTQELLQTRLTGARIVSIERLDHSWFFRFDTGAQLVTEDLWRVMTPSIIAITSKDDGQQFGHKRPVEAAKVARAHLKSAISTVDLDPVTGDLRLGFRDGAILQMLNTSSGYEGWRATWPDGLNLVAMGGGKVVGG